MPGVGGGGGGGGGRVSEGHTGLVVGLVLSGVALTLIVVAAVAMRDRVSGGRGREGKGGGGSAREPLRRSNVGVPVGVRGVDGHGEV